MSGPDEPQWELLPDRPEEFFGLEGDYDVLDLKRKYNSFIRKFKPEKFPEEFQKIRAAFESLNDALRYGEPLPSSQHLQFDWSSDTEQSDSELQNELTGSPAADPLYNSSSEATDKGQKTGLLERLKDEPIDVLYAELKQQTSKSPYDYYALAVFADLLPETKGNFAGWILEGLKAHQEEPGLFELLKQYFSQEIPLKELASLLLKTSRIVNSDRFYYLTEKGWDRLIRNAPFKIFRKTLSSCEANLRDHRVDNLLVFYLHILKPAIWKASQKWIDQIFAEVDSHYDELPYWLEREYYLLDLLRQYRDQRDTFIQESAIRETIDRAIRNYSVLPESEADLAFLECQLLLISYEDDLLTEFPKLDKQLLNLRILWELIADDVYERVEVYVEYSESEQRDSQIQKLADQLFHENYGRRYQNITEMTSTTYVLLFLASIISIIYLIFRMFSSFWSSLLYIGLIVLTNFIFFVLAALSSNWLRDRYYRAGWRFEIMRFFQTCWLPLDEVAEGLEALNGTKKDDIEYEELDEIANLMRLDPGLFIYVTAQRLLHASH